MQERKGFLIVFEGLDRCGKTTQSKMLNDALDDMWREVYLSREGSVPGHPRLFKFPDRTSFIGELINRYLQAEDHAVGFDQVIHLLFSANRWEKKFLIDDYLSYENIIIVDRYTYSGVAYSAAKGLDYEWCKNCDVGLPEPDLVIFLDMKVEDLIKRGGFGEERYEKADFLEKVNDVYKKIMEENDNFVIFDANEDVEVLHKKILRTVLEKIRS